MLNGQRTIMLNKKVKEKIIKKFQVHKTDTGSPEVQIAILSKEIDELNAHLKNHRHDFSSRRGLLKKLSERRKLIKYLQKENSESMYKIAEQLKIKVIKKENSDCEEMISVERDKNAAIKKDDDGDADTDGGIEKK